MGGFTEALKIADWCEAHDIDLMPHNPLGPVCTAATIHLAAAAPNFAWQEVRAGEASFDFDARLFPAQPPLQGDGYPLPIGPGLGVEVNEDMPHAEIRLWEAPRLRRRDGPYTNW